MKIENLVKFNNNASCAAAVWCRENDIQAKVVNVVHVDEAGAYIVIDAGLGYVIYATKEQVDIVSESGYLSPIDKHILRNAPLFNEGY